MMLETAFDSGLIKAYRRDGVILLRGLVPAEAVEMLRRMADLVQEVPLPLRATNGEALPDSYLWLVFSEIEEALLSLPLARVAAALMGSRSARLFYDQVFVKPSGHSMPTPWHQDASHWCLKGEQICSIWLALDEIGPMDGGLRYLVGSHLSGIIFRPQSRDGLPWPETEGETAPDFESPEFRASEVSFILRPGDVVVHHARTVHASFSNSMGTHARRAYVTRWLGDDVVYQPRGFTMPMPLDVKLTPGSSLEHTLFPKLHVDVGSDGCSSSH